MAMDIESTTTSFSGLGSLAAEECVILWYKMPRDKKIRIAFEVADDSMQGVIGYFYYAIACKEAADESKISLNLPKNTIPITLEWERYYNKQDLLKVMNKGFELYHSRICLISIISIFEAALHSFIEQLNKTGHISNTKKKKLRNYKKKLEWAFSLVSGSFYGTDSMKERVPELCLWVDHARRIRNLWMHNNGLLNKEYFTDYISVSDKQPIFLVSIHDYRKSKEKIPIALIPDGFISTGCSHIELLHQIHYNVQQKYYGQKRAYSYRALRKNIEWHRILKGF